MSSFSVQIFCVAFSLLSIYICLKWYKFPFIARKEEEMREKEDYGKWVSKMNTYRMLVLLLGILVNGAAYFLIDYVGAMYLAIMMLLCVPFVISKRNK